MNGVSDDPGSLDRLHDVIAPPPAPWWPPAPGWWIAGGLIVVGTALLAAALILRWRANWYRRAGLAELRRLEQDAASPPGQLVQVAALVKRVALVAYPRHEVASLTGIEWLRFLDRSAHMSVFAEGPGRLLGSVYEPVPATPTAELFEVVRAWIRQHRRDFAC